jgi:hypothetical protein
MQNRQYPPHQHGLPYHQQTSGPPKSQDLSAYPELPPLYQHRSSNTFGERPGMSAFYPAHDRGSASPNDHNSTLGEPLRSGLSGSGAPSPVHMSAMMMHNPKRAYRQRRKDPSCDACRERKVKVRTQVKSMVKFV